MMIRYRIGKWLLGAHYQWLANAYTQARVAENVASNLAATRLQELRRLRAAIDRETT